MFLLSILLDYCREYGTTCRKNISLFFLYLNNDCIQYINNLIYTYLSRDQHLDPYDLIIKFINIEFDTLNPTSFEIKYSCSQYGILHEDIDSRYCGEAIDRKSVV